MEVKQFLATLTKSRPKLAKRLANLYAVTNRADDVFRTPTGKLRRIRRGESLEDRMDVMLKNGKIANRRARVRSVEDAYSAMEIRGIPVDAYVIHRLGDVLTIYWYQS